MGGSFFACTCVCVGGGVREIYCSTQKTLSQHRARGSGRDKIGRLYIFLLLLLLRFLNLKVWCQWLVIS